MTKKRNPIARVVTHIKPRVIPPKNKDYSWMDELVRESERLGLYDIGEQTNEELDLPAKKSDSE